jgi:hypothetical protein
VSTAVSTVTFSPEVPKSELTDASTVASARKENASARCVVEIQSGSR